MPAQIFPIPDKARENILRFGKNIKTYDISFCVTTEVDTFMVMQRVNAYTQREAVDKAITKVHQRYPSASFMHITGSKTI